MGSQESNRSLQYQYDLESQLIPNWLNSKFSPPTMKCGHCMIPYHTAIYRSFKNHSSLIGIISKPILKLYASCFNFIHNSAEQFVSCRAALQILKSPWMRLRHEKDSDEFQFGYEMESTFQVRNLMSHHFFLA